MVVSLIISTYNWPDALACTLWSAMRQSRPPDEIIVADDGSKEDTGQRIREISALQGIPILHIWQEDEGFQLAKIRNKAFAESRGDYIIQVDGDVLLHRDFIKDHLRTARPNSFVQGGRVVLGPTISKKILHQQPKRITIFQPDIHRREEGIRCIPLANFLSSRYRNRHPIYFARGANMAFWKKDLIEVNGYNENFANWGHEDSELTLRLLNAGKKKLYLKFSGIVYHIYHPEHHSKKNDAENEKLLMATKQAGTIYTPIGLAQYIHHDKRN